MNPKLPRSVGVVVLAGTSLGFVASQFQAEDVAVGDWQLVWSDEFEGAGLPDSRWWAYEEGYVRNDEAQYYTRARTENARQENGMLVLEARKDNWQGHAYTSASLTTRYAAAWTYGRVEVRAQVPAGRGAWPAIWMLGTNIGEVGWPDCGEIDIMEYVGYQPGIVHGTVHTKAYNHAANTARGNTIAVADAADAMHVYAIEWDEDRIRFFVDDAQYFEFEDDGTGEAAWPYFRPQYLILNYAVGGSWGGSQGIDDSIFPSKYKIDYVRVYQRKKPGPYSLSATAIGPGALHVEPIKALYGAGETVRLSADPDIGMRLKGWSGIQTDRALVADVVMNRDLTVEALFVEPGGLTANGVFAAGLDGWYQWVSDQAAAHFAVADGALRATVSKAGPEAWHAQWGQGGIALEEGMRYRLSFDAWMEAGKGSIDAKLARNIDPFSAYATWPAALSSVRQSFVFNYTHAAPSNTNCRIEFNVSKSAGIYRFDSIRLQPLDADPLGPYEAWKRDRGIRPIDDAGDADGDAVANLFEYIYGRSPHLSEPIAQPLAEASVEDGKMWLQLGNGALSEDALIDIALKREASHDLAVWTPVEEPIEVISAEPQFLRLRTIAEAAIEP